METRDNQIKKYIFLAIIIIFAFFLFLSLIQFFTAFLSAVIFYVLSKGFAEKLIKKRHWKKSTAAILVIIVSFFIILLPVTLLVTLLFNKVSHVVANPADVISSIKKFSTVIQSKTGFQLFSDKTLASIQEYGTTLLSAILSSGLGFVSTILMMYFFLYFMIMNINRMEAAIIFYLPFKKEKIIMFGNQLVALTFSNAVGIPLIAVAQGLLGYIAYRITGVNESGFWGVITGFCSVIPIIGSGIIWIPIVAFHFITGHTWQGIFVLLWAALMMGTIDNVIRFVLAKRMADVHPIITVLGVIMGLKYFGFVGLVVGPILISYFTILLKIYYVEYQKPVFFRPQKPRPLMPTYMQPLLRVRRLKQKK